MPIRVLSFVGTFSYSLYLVHLLAIGIILWTFKRMGIGISTPLYICRGIDPFHSCRSAYVFFTATSKGRLWRSRNAIAGGGGG